MNKQISIDGLPPIDKDFKTKQNKKKRWEKGFQKWSDKHSQDGRTPLGKCGYGSMCDYCSALHGNPCVRALNEMCRDKKITIDYTKKNYQEIWESDNGD